MEIIKKIRKSLQFSNSES